MPKTCINFYTISSMKMRMIRIKVDVMYCKQQERLGREPASDVVAGVSLIYTNQIIAWMLMNKRDRDTTALHIVAPSLSICGRCYVCVCFVNNHFISRGIFGSGFLLLVSCIVKHTRCDVQQSVLINRFIRILSGCLSCLFLLSLFVSEH